MGTDDGGEKYTEVSIGEIGGACESAMAGV